MKIKIARDGHGWRVTRPPFGFTGAETLHAPTWHAALELADRIVSGRGGASSTTSSEGYLTRWTLRGSRI